MLQKEKKTNEKQKQPKQNKTKTKERKIERWKEKNTHQVFTSSKRFMYVIHFVELKMFMRIDFVKYVPKLN